MALVYAENFGDLLERQKMVYAEAAAEIFGEGSSGNASGESRAGARNDPSDGGWIGEDR